MALKTPSGLTLSEAEKLSIATQRQIAGTMPQAGELVKMSIGEGAYKLGIKQGDVMSWLDTGQFRPQAVNGQIDWQGRTIGSWVSGGTSALLGQLGKTMEDFRTLNSSDYRQQFFTRTQTPNRTTYTPIAGFSEKTIGSKEFTGMFGQPAVQPTIQPTGATPPTPSNILAAPVPTTPTTTDPLASIRTVFGPTWQPSPAFTPELQAKGIYGAVRITGTNEVYTIGPGGTLETPESFQQKFGTLEQGGIVGEVSTEQARQLGIQVGGEPTTPVAPTPVAPTPPISPEVPEAISPLAPDAPITPESSLAGIRSVFGQDWQPAPAFTPELQAQGIFGAVRIKGTNEVYTIGPGGRKETAESFLQRFGTSEQKGIVGEITKEQAVRLGITDTAQTPVAPTGGVTIEALGDVDEIDLTGAEGGAGGGATYATDTAIAGLDEYLKQQEALKTQAEKEKEEEVEDLTAQIKTMLEEGDTKASIQLEEEKEREIEAKQQAIDDANGELSIKLAEINSLTASYNLENQIVEGKPITLGRMEGQKGQNYKMFLAQKNLLTSEAQLLQAKSLAIQGKLDSAQAAADRAVDLRWSDYTERLDRQSILLQLVQGELTELEQERADAMNYWIDQQKTMIADQKAREKQIQNIMLSVVGIAPNNVLAQISRATSVLEASQIASSYLAPEVPTTRGAGLAGITPTEEPLSINQIEQFRRSYGWTPPLGFTQAQLIQYMDDNPNATPEQLEAGARQAQGGGETPEDITPQTNFPDTVGHIMNTMTDAEMDALFAKAKTAGVTKLLRGKRNDVQAYIETFKDKIEEAVNAGYSKEEIKQQIFKSLGL